MPKALLIRYGKLQNFAYTFVTSFPSNRSTVLHFLLDGATFWVRSTFRTCWIIFLFAKYFLKILHTMKPHFFDEVLTKYYLLVVLFLLAYSVKCVLKTLKFSSIRSIVYTSNIATNIGLREWYKLYIVWHTSMYSSSIYLMLRYVTSSHSIKFHCPTSSSSDALNSDTIEFIPTNSVCSWDLCCSVTYTCTLNLLCLDR